MTRASRTGGATARPRTAAHRAMTGAVVLIVLAAAAHPSAPVSAESALLGATTRARWFQDSPWMAPAGLHHLRGGGWLSRTLNVTGMWASTANACAASAASAAISLVSPRKETGAQASPFWALRGIRKTPSRRASQVVPPRGGRGSQSRPSAPVESNNTRQTQRPVFQQPAWTPPDNTSVNSMLKSLPHWSTDGNGMFTADASWRQGMRVPARFWASKDTLSLEIKEYLKDKARRDAGIPCQGGFLPSVIQLGNVANLPGTLGCALAMPDMHSGYGFPIGGVAAMDLDNEESVVSPGGVGFDINCGVRLLRTNLTADQIKDTSVKEKLADMLFQMIPVGVGVGSVYGQLSEDEQDDILRNGMKWCESKGLCWPEDRLYVEEHGCFEGADPGTISVRAKKRGRMQCGSMGAGNHYAEVQEVDAIFDEAAAEAMGLRKGNVVVMIHSGSRGLGHQVCTEAIGECERVMPAQKLDVADRQLACCRIQSPAGQRYLAAMRCAANYAFVSRSLIAHAVRASFAKIFNVSAHQLDMGVVYDVSHNICKEEEHTVAGEKRRVLVHRKGATRSFPPEHPAVPAKYAQIGQPVLVGGSMGTASWVLTGTAEAMQLSFGSTCHGAGRCMGRSQAARTFDTACVLEHSNKIGVTLRVASKQLAAEEFHKVYKDVDDVVEVCHTSGLSKKAVRLRPLICIKG